MNDASSNYIWHEIHLIYQTQLPVGDSCVNVAPKDEHNCVIYGNMLAVETCGKLFHRTTRRAWGIYIQLSSLPSEAIGYLAIFNAVTAMA